MGVWWLFCECGVVAGYTLKVFMVCIRCWCGVGFCFSEGYGWGFVVWVWVQQG